MRTYRPAELDRASKLITYGMLILFSVTIIMSLIFSFSFYVTYFLIGVLLIGFLLKPISYSITKEGITIHFFLVKKTLRKDDILDVKIIPAQELNNSIRTFGVGGFFGYNGYFANKKFGKMIWFVTNRNNVVLITLKNNKKYIISPKSKEEFNFSFDPNL